MKTKIKKTHVDKGFGFPIELQNVPMTQVRGKWVPKINYKELGNLVLREFIDKNTRLTGNELKFIRQKLEMTLTEFAELFDVSHPAVIKWEKAENEFTNMSWPTEKDVRLTAADHLNRSHFRRIFQNLRKCPEIRKSVINVNFDEENQEK